LIVDFSIFPVDKGESVSAYVSKAVKIIKGSGLPYQLGPMGTCIEGEWDEVMALVGRCFRAMQEDSGRVYMTMKVDYRKGGSGRMEGKIQSIESKV
jgi:uncharacterized protein (TIGR00106 family)